MSQGFSGRACEFGCYGSQFKLIQKHIRLRYSMFNGEAKKLFLDFVVFGRRYLTAESNKAFDTKGRTA